MYFLATTCIPDVRVKPFTYDNYIECPKYNAPFIIQFSSNLDSMHLRTFVEVYLLIIDDIVSCEKWQ